MSAPPEPVTAAEREPILDLLRGFALLGILLVNIELMRGPALYDALVGVLPAPVSRADEVTQFLTGWLAAGKFVSSFALLFGVGAALLAGRAAARGSSPRRLLARRYTLLAVFGLVHMVLLFPGDVLFLYALTGFALLLFLDLGPRGALAWAGLILAGLTAVSTLATWAATQLPALNSPVDDPFTVAMEGFFAGRGEAAVAAYTEGGVLAVLGARSFEAAVVQGGALLTLPWVLALFLIGFAATRAGVATAPGEHRVLLRRLAVVGLGVGLPVNLVLGRVGTLGAAMGTVGELEDAWVMVAVVPAQLLGAPLLAVGYLATLTLLGLRFGVWRPLAAVGRMALTAYLTQSLTATVVFVGLGTYGSWSATEALAVVVGTWVLLLVACPLWLRWFRFGPVEWVWRRWTYRSPQPMRR